MPVLSVLIKDRQEARMSVAACKYGVPAEVIDREGDAIYVDLFGSSDKTRRVAWEVGAEVLDEVDKVHDPMA